MADELKQPSYEVKERNWRVNFKACIEAATDAKIYRGLQPFSDTVNLRQT
jgi:hypothetical protein